MSDKVEIRVETWSLWKSLSNGLQYRVICVTNCDRDENNDEPVTVVYENVDTGYKLSMPLSQWCNMMTKVSS